MISEYFSILDIYLLLLNKNSKHINFLNKFAANYLYAEENI